MPRKKHSDTELPQAAEASPGHNSGELTDDQKQVLWFQSKKKIVALKDKIASLTGDLRNEYKKLKSDLSITKAEVDFALALGKDDDDKMMEAERRRRILARWEGHAIGVQADLFADGVDRTPSVEKAYDAGKRVGLAGDPCKNPHDPSVPQYQTWLEGFHAGQAVLAGGIKTKPAADGDAHLLSEAEKRRGSDAVDSLTSAH